MNKIVREHYPVSKLPEDLREGMDETAKVTVIVESAAEFGGLPELEEQPPMTPAEAFKAIMKYKALRYPSIEPDEAVARIRALRDEWDDE